MKKNTVIASLSDKKLLKELRKKNEKNILFPYPTLKTTQRTK